MASLKHSDHSLSWTKRSSDRLYIGKLVPAGVSFYYVSVRTLLDRIELVRSVRG